MTNKTFTLKAIGKVSVKSHYGKAKVMDCGNGVYALLSYDTIVAAGTRATAEKSATLYRIYDVDFEYFYGGWSATTARHLESFATFLGATYNGKADWTAKPYRTLEEVINENTLKVA